MDTKQIFEWLIEQINREKVSEYDKEDASFNLGLSNAISKVYRAEAKWEAECCEWHYAKGGYYKTVVASPHKEFISLKTSDLKSQPYCGHCGKPIKISEVE